MTLVQDHLSSKWPQLVSEFVFGVFVNLEPRTVSHFHSSGTWVNHREVQAEQPEDFRGKTLVRPLCFCTVISELLRSS